jgi:hypothetical protein
MPRRWGAIRQSRARSDSDTEPDAEFLAKGAKSAKVKKVKNGSDREFRVYDASLTLARSAFLARNSDAVLLMLLSAGDLREQLFICRPRLSARWARRDQRHDTKLRMIDVVALVAAHATRLLQLITLSIFCR